jgi:Polysaccharide deacetylase
LHAATVTLLLLAACQHDAAETTNAFYSWDDRTMHCAINLDTYARNGLASIETGLDRAVETGEVLELYAHDPGRTITWAELEAVLAAITARSLPYFTYAELASRSVTPSAGVVLSFDDAAVDSWLAGADLYDRYGARMTFFVAYYDHLSPERRESLHELARRGHAIEAHSVNHLRAPLFVERRGLTAYLQEEALPSIDWLRADGFPVTTYAYPYGARTAELDTALADPAGGHVTLVRSVSFTWTGVADPCPN